jgi:UDP-glucose 4-epimerase
VPKPPASSTTFVGTFGEAKAGKRNIRTTDGKIQRSVKNVLITGGAGFIGSHLAAVLLARGDSVLVIDNYATGRRENLVSNPRLEVVLGTIADADLVGGAFARFRPEVVVHAAASYKDPQDWAEDIRTNVLGTANVVQSAARSAVSRIIYLQTALCYGRHPLELPITLEHPIRPESSYSISKTAGEQYIELSGLDFLSFRLANAYGPRNFSGPLPTFYDRLTSQRKCFVSDSRRDFIYVDDLIEVLRKAIDGQGRRGFYHVSSGSDISIKELFDAAVRAIGVELQEPVEVRPRGPDDAATILLDPSKTNRDFDWKVRTSLEDGVARAVAYYREHGVGQTYTHLKSIPR